MTPGNTGSWRRPACALVVRKRAANPGRHGLAELCATGSREIRPENNTRLAIARLPPCWPNHFPERCGRKWSTLHGRIFFRERGVYGVTSGQKGSNGKGALCGGRRMNGGRLDTRGSSAPPSNKKSRLPSTAKGGFCRRPHQGVVVTGRPTGPCVCRAVIVVHEGPGSAEGRAHPQRAPPWRAGQSRRNSNVSGGCTRKHGGKRTRSFGRRIGSVGQPGTSKTRTKRIC